MVNQPPQKSSGSNSLTPPDGGDSSDVQDELKNVEHIQANSLAFAALKTNGSVVTWGTLDAGGDSSVVQDQLHDVTKNLGA